MNKFTQLKESIDQQKIKAFLHTKLAFPAMAAIGLIITILVIKLQPNMEHNLPERPSIPVNFINAEQHNIQPEIIGFGVVQPDLDLKAKAEVSGRVVYIHPALKKGQYFKKGTLLIKIDDKDYILQLKQAEADLLANKASLTEMELSIENNKLELELANEKLAVRKQEYARSKELVKKGLVSKSSFDAEKQNLLQQRQEVLKLKNLQTTLPSQLAVMQAKVDISKFTLEKSKRDLARTNISIPFNGRISNVFTELNQYVLKSAAIFDAFSLEKIIINAQFPIDQFSMFAKNFNLADGTAKNSDDGSGMEKILASSQLTAIVTEVGGQFKNWQAKVERFSDNLDPRSMTIGVIVSVEGSYENIQPGSKPPLLQGMYMKVSLQGSPQKFITIPRFTLHQNEIFRVSKNDKLERVSLNKSQTNGNFILVDHTLSVGDKIITSDIFPAVNGMSVTPILDEASQAKINTWLGQLSGAQQ